MKFQPSIAAIVNTINKLILISSISLILFACAEKQVIVKQQPTGDPTRLKIVNTTAEIIDSIVFRPCGSAQGDFETLTRIVKPKEKVSVVLYDNCVELIAYDSFRRPMSKKPALKLADHNTWNIE